MQKIIIIVGLVILVVGLLWPILVKLPLGRLPGDIVIKGENSRFYFPITTMIVISIILSVVLSWFRR